MISSLLHGLTLRHAFPGGLTTTSPKILNSYTKALEAIKKHRKEQSQAIRELKLKLENFQNQKDIAHKVHHFIPVAEEVITKLHQIRRELQSKQGFQDSAAEQIKELQEQIEELEKEATELKRKTNAISALMSEFSNLKAVQAQMINEKNKTYDELKEEFEGRRCQFHLFVLLTHFLLQESDEELIQLSASFNKDVSDKENAAKEIEEKLATLSKNKEKHEGLLLSLKEQSGTLKSTIEVTSISRCSR